jgi:hypothetical protein
MIFDFILVLIVILLAHIVSWLIERWQHTKKAHRQGLGERVLSSMIRADELAARAAELSALAERVDDACLAESLRQRARHWRAVAHEIAVLQRGQTGLIELDGRRTGSRSRTASIRR